MKAAHTFSDVFSYHLITLKLHILKGLLFEAMRVSKFSQHLLKRSKLCLPELV